MTKKIVFIGGKQIGVECLRILIQSNLKPALVISNLDDKGKDTWHESLVKLAKKEKLNYIKNKKISDKSVVKKIKSINPDIIFCFGGTQIISKEILTIPKEGVLNLHPALLPKYRGRYSTVHAIYNGENKTGVTLHLMDSGIDSGPIISQISFPILKSDTARSVYDNFTIYGSKLFENYIKLWIKGNEIKAKKQNPKIATYFPKGLPNNGEINWKWNGDKIYNLIRSLTFEPFEPASFMIGNKKMVIVEEKYFKGYK